MSFDYDPALGLYISVDPGYSNPFACLWIMPVEKGERVMVLDEYYQRFRTTPENARAIARQHQEMGHPPLRMGYGDPANPERLVLLSEVLGIEVKGPRLPVEVGQEMVRQWMERRYDGHPCLVIQPSLQEPDPGTQRTTASTSRVKGSTTPWTPYGISSAAGWEHKENT